MAANRQVITNHVHEHIDKEFEPGLAANVQMYADTYEMKNALHILDEARRPVELSQNRQGRLGSLSGSLKMIRPQMVTLSEQQRNVVKAGVKIIVQPGGSKKDQEVIDAANKAKIKMVFTGIRHFNH